MCSTSWSELFPTRTSAVIFILYILLFANQAILVTNTQGSKNEYEFNIATVVLMTELVKLSLSMLLYLKDNTLASLLTQVLQNPQLLALYFIPAFLYCLYNILAFVNLATFDPTTYYLLLQLRVVITGILFQIIFKKQLSKSQWYSLVLLTIGCMLKQADFGDIETDFSMARRKNTLGFDLSLSSAFVIIQVMCSCLAGLYNEHLLKHEGADMNIYVHNIFMYLDSIICNIVVLLYQGNIHDAFKWQHLSLVFHYKVLLIIINNAVAGITTSLFLKSLNSILKTFSSALEIIVIAVMSYIFFGIPIRFNAVLAICVVSFATILYSRNPVVNVITKNVGKGQLIKNIV